ncbi:radical SAM protein [Candidatus Woesearchaeota archaeon]|nr:radical SAM protein [Candidatus Woesearchaeota archaeon]
MYMKVIFPHVFFRLNCFIKVFLILRNFILSAALQLMQAVYPNIFIQWHAFIFMAYTILDCYTDEPAGLGVPPYLGTYPRYIYGYLKSEDFEVNYITIDDLRLFRLSKMRKQRKTDIRVYNLTRNFDGINRVLNSTDEMIIVLGVHTPGKYLSALPATLNEALKLVRGLKFRKILTGPAVFGTASEGGRFYEKADLGKFDSIEKFDFSYSKVKEYSVLGAEIILQIPDLRIVEIETGHGCTRPKGCSFCMEPLKHKLEFRNKKDIIDEIGSFYDLGVRDFRLGKQSCFYTYPDAVGLLNEIRGRFPDLRTLHIDNANPNMVLKKEKVTEAIVKNCTSGNVAAFGVESFDPDVISANNLNCNPSDVYSAVKVLNEYGKEVGSNGMPKFLPGLNILFGLGKESKQTHVENMKWLTKILENDLLLRRINIRQVNIFEGTPLFDFVGNKFLKKNKKHYWKWRNEIRQKIDFPMLKKMLPLGSVLRDVRMEVHDGNHTFGRQIGTYPLIVGVNKKLELKKFYNIKVVGHMLRSVVGEAV